MIPQKNNAFTLVELIVVIVILAILSTISFLSFNSYSSSSRDSVRLSDITNIAKGLTLQYSIGGSYIIPDNSVSLLSGSTTIIGYQGKAGYNTLNSIKLSTSNNNSGKDPLDNTYYTYNINSNKNKYQLSGFLENKGNIINRTSSINNTVENRKYKIENNGINGLIDLSISLRYTQDDDNGSLINQTYSTTYTNRYPYTKGDSIGVILSYTGNTTSNTNNTIYTPIEDNIGTSTGIDISSGTLTSGKIVINNNTDSSTGVSIVSMSGYVSNVITSQVIVTVGTLSNPGLSCNDIKTQIPASTDGIYRIKPDSNPAFQVYCDMTTDGGGWTLVMNLDTNDGNNESYNSAFWYSNTVNYGAVTGALTGDYKYGTGFNLVTGSKFLLKVHQEGSELAHMSFNLNQTNKSLSYFFNAGSNIQLTNGILFSGGLSTLNANEPTIKQSTNLRVNTIRGSNNDLDRVSIGGSISDNYGGGLGTWYDSAVDYQRPYNDGQLLNCSWAGSASCTIGTDVGASCYAPRVISSGLQYDYAFYLK